jgi:hypothetical protein
MELVHVLNILKMSLGIFLLFTAVILWSLFKRYSSAALAVTSLLLYVQIALDLLDAYGVIDKNAFLVYNDIPILQYALPILTICSFIMTLLVFIKEEKKSR